MKNAKQKRSQKVNKKSLVTKDYYKFAKTTQHFKLLVELYHISMLQKWVSCVKSSFVYCTYVGFVTDSFLGKIFTKCQNTESQVQRYLYKCTPLFQLLYNLYFTESGNQ